MGILVRNRAHYHQSGLMEVQQRRGDASEHQHHQQLMTEEPRLPSGWEKCLDLKSGLIYFRDWNSGTLTYRDPRQQQSVVSLATQQRIGLLSISTSEQILRTSTDDEEGTRTVTDTGTASGTKRKTMHRSSSVEQSLELSLNLPGTSRTDTSAGSSQDGSVCTMAKVRSALERSQWLPGRTRLATNYNRTSPSQACSDPTTTTLSLFSSSSSPSGSRLQSESRSKSDNSAATSQCSSEGFTSPSVMSFQGDEEEVQQPGDCRDSEGKSHDAPAGWSSSSAVMVTVGCKSCLMYVMLSKSHPSCPKCGNTDVLLELPPAPLPKKRRTTTLENPSWSWCST